MLAGLKLYSFSLKIGHSIRILVVNNYNLHVAKMIKNII